MVRNCTMIWTYIHASWSTRINPNSTQTSFQTNQVQVTQAVSDPYFVKLFLISLSTSKDIILLSWSLALLLCETQYMHVTICTYVRSCGSNYKVELMISLATCLCQIQEIGVKTKFSLKFGFPQTRTILIKEAGQYDAWSILEHFSVHQFARASVCINCITLWTIVLVV